MGKFPLVKQHDAMDCGAACLKMIAQYYGKNYSLEYLKDTCYLSREGVSLLSISDAAENIGFKTLGGRFTLEKLSNQAPLPCILHWEQDHFVVLYKIGKKFVHIADPAHGKITYKIDEFHEKWLSTRTDGKEKGVALLLEPTPAFYRKKSNSSGHTSIRFLVGYLMKYKKYFVQLLLGLLLGSIVQLIFPFLTQAIVDIGIADKNLGFIYLILLAQLVLFISRMSVDFTRRWILLHISTRVNLSLISDFFIKIMKLPMDFFDSRKIGDITQRVGDHERIERFLTASTLSTLFQAFNFIVFGAILFIYSLKIFLVFVLGSIIYIFWILLFLKKRKALDYKYFGQHSKNQSIIYQLITGMQEIKLQNCEKRKRWEWEDNQADLFKTGIASLSLEQIQKGGNLFINEIKNIFITIIAATSVINDEITLGMMLAIQYIIGQMQGPIENSIQFIHDFQDTKISLERVNEIHKRQNEDKDKVLTLENLHLHDIRLNNVSFQYEGPHSPLVLNNINLSIPKGKTTAIVGSSGSGKTTLVKLLLQYYKPVDGEIYIGHSPLSKLNPTWWRKQCGTVMQDGYIFSESIAQNIAVSDHDEIDKERLQFAAQTANLFDHINSLPLKFNTVIGIEGKGLSSGQKQRILIARAVYKNPQFLFFDEATNALDANNEKKIVNNLAAFSKDKTVVIVAHRLSTVKNADQIVVLDEGKIIETGTHEQLVKRKSAYYNLVKNQLELGA